jgi:uncharacterized repeat protein (TIGR03803 family)
VFQVTPALTETVLYSFAGGTDASFPFCALVRTEKGDFYGTTVFGGAFNEGTVFKLDSSGVETVLYSFSGGTDGGLPVAGLVLDQAGNLYGTSSKGGASGNGTVFRIRPSGEEKILYSFQGGTDGSLPSAALILDPKGNLFGTTDLGGASGYGTVFKISSSGEERILYSFKGGADGASPTAPLVRDASGSLYGTTFAGGTSGFGTVFKVTP